MNRPPLASSAFVNLTGLTLLEDKLHSGKHVSQIASAMGFRRAVALCLWIICMAGAPASAAARVLDVGASAPATNLASPITLAAYFDVLEDPGRTLTLADLRGQNSAQPVAWRAVSAPEVNYGYSPSAYWLRLHLRNSGETPVNRLIELRHWGLEQIEFHQTGADGAARSVVTGSLTPFGSRPYAHRYFVFPITLTAHAEQWVYLRVQSTPVIVPAVLWEPEPFHAYERNDYIAQALFFGLAIAMLFYNLLLFIGTRLSVYLWYVLFVACTTLTLADQNGLAKEFLWPDAQAWSAISVNVGYSLSLATVLLFMRQMLNTRSVAPQLDRILKWVAAIHLVSPLGFALAFDLLAKPATYLYGGTALLILASSLWLVVRRQRAAYFFFPAFFMSLFGTLMLALRAFAVVPSNVFTVNGTQFGSAVEMLLLAFALADRLNVARREKQDAQRDTLRAQAELVAALKSSEQALEARVHQRTAELTVARDEADRANRGKSVFLAKISHELRTPMHAMLGYLDLALRERLVPAAARQLATARKAGQQLISQINDLLDFARMERALLKLELHSVGLQQWLQQIKDRTELLALERGNLFVLEVAANLPGWVRIDANRLEQVLMALLSNALRYTQRGTVVLRLAWDGRCRRSDSGEQMFDLHFEVVDSGRGISPAALSRIFQAFERGDSVDTDGLGLGLPIAEQLLGLMGSKLDVSSVVGEGSRFGFDLTVQGSEESEALTQPKRHDITGYTGRMRHVLVLDDNPTSRSYLEELLGDLGFAVHSFGTVHAAMDDVESLAADQQGPDLCIVDQHLEGRSTGWDFVLALRGSNRAPAAVRESPVLMLSATEAQRPAGWALTRDIDRHLLKPADQRALLQCICELLELTWTMPERVASSPAMLVVSDSDASDSSDVWSDADWQALKAAAENGDLTAIDEWATRHASGIAQDAPLQRLLNGLDFPLLARLAAQKLGQNARSV